MYEVSVERIFCAGHAIRLAGVMELAHGHNWHVCVTVAADRLDDEELVCDFHLLEQALDATLEPYRNRMINDVAPFDRVNPTAEAIARQIAESVAAALPSQKDRDVRVSAVSVTEAPGCRATYRPGGQPGGAA